MDVAKTAAYLLLPLLVTVIAPGQVWGQSGAPGTKLRRVVPPDTETMVASASRFRYREGEGQKQCSSERYSGTRTRNAAQARYRSICRRRSRCPKRVGLRKLGVRTGGLVSTGPRVRRQGSVYLQRSA